MSPLLCVLHVLVPVPGCCDWLGPGLAARGRVNEGGGRGQESRTAAELGRGLGTDTAILITRSRDGESFEQKIWSFNVLHTAPLITALHQVLYPRK